MTLLGTIRAVMGDIPWVMLSGTVNQALLEQIKSVFLVPTDSLKLICAPSTRPELLLSVRCMPHRVSTSQHSFPFRHHRNPRPVITSLQVLPVASRINHLSDLLIRLADSLLSDEEAVGLVYTM